MNKHVVQDIKMIKRENEAMHESAARRIIDEYKLNGSSGRGSRRGKNSRLAIWGIAGISVAVLFFAISLLFAKASVTVTPKTEDISLDGSTYTAGKDTATAAIRFELGRTTGEESMEVPAEKTGEKVTQKAKGSVIIYNEFGTAGQKLIANTRLESTDGKIYRIDNPVTVPGYTMKDGKKTPGSIKVSVTADQSGESYNAGLTDFTIPGLKGDPRYDKFYARSETPISGGVTGVVNSISQETYTKAKSALIERLETRLASELRAQIPEGYVLLADALIFTENPSSKVPTLYSTDTTIPLSVKGSITAIVVDETALTSAIAKDTVSQYAGEPVIMKNKDGLSFALTSPDLITDETKEITFSISGMTELVFAFDENKLARDLAGAQKSDFKTILKEYDSIDKAEISIRPFWKLSFPESPDAIKITNTVLSDK
ncbi:MAG: hypothetical protein MUD00_03480 [Candidatus Pacebacteria bacterium]|nr:hypothetical protein [Candidatus Paceibacterota bacterium]